MDLNEIKTHYAFCLLDKALDTSPEQMAVWLLQHTEAKRLLRFVSRAYTHKALQNFVRQQGLDRDMNLELSALLGGAAWELEQSVALQAVNKLLQALSGEGALRQTQISASLLKLFNLKDLLQQH